MRALEGRMDAPSDRVGGISRTPPRARVLAYHLGPSDSLPCRALRDDVACEMEEGAGADAVPGVAEVVGWPADARSDWLHLGWPGRRRILGRDDQPFAQWRRGVGRHCDCVECRHEDDG